MDLLPKWERCFYWVSGICSVAYSQWTFYKTSQDLKPYLGFHKGWTFLGGKRDALDYEWICFQSCALKLVLLAAGHLILSHALVRLRLNYRIFTLLLLVYDTLAFAYVLGAKVTLLFLLEVLLMFAACLQDFISVVWILGMVMTSSLNYSWVEKWQVFEDWHTTYDKQLFYISNAYLHLRVMSASIEIIKQRRSRYESDKHLKKNTHETSFPLQQKDANKNDSSELVTECAQASLLDVISYSMYFPTSIYGPLVTFDGYHRHKKYFFHTKGQIHCIKDIIFLTIRILFWGFFLEFTAHFMYPNSLSLNLNILDSFSAPEMIGFVLWESLYFLMKYVVLFGMGSLACKIDGLSPPPLPRCTVTLYRYTDTWKYFDTGYYNFIKKYIYIPLGGSQCGFLWQAGASVAAFAFIYYWHGASFDIFLWAAGNWSVIALEMIVIHFLKSKRGSSLMSLLSPAAKLRIKAVLYVPGFILSSVQIACFFFSKDVAYIMADVMILRASWSAILLQIACFYVNLHNAIYITENIHERKRKVD